MKIKTIKYFMYPLYYNEHEKNLHRYIVRNKYKVKGNKNCDN